ncbi:hypothetical protein C0991_003573 [Blastosporella zonata]|nr:hypothetical protein C0991_003573 [Blastosporella zonata]
MDADNRPLRSLQKAPQVIVAPLPLSSNAQSSSLLVPRAGPSSKPASVAPVDIDPQSQRHADVLAELGIKVRDFAYESKLPPVQPYRVRQIQPGPRPLKRLRKDGEEDDGDVFQTSTASENTSSKKLKLKREDTEPDVSQEQPYPRRDRGFKNINYEPRVPPWFQSQPSEFSQSIELYQQFESQECEPYVITPVVTPNGSLQWPDAVGTTSDIPASQLDTESQANDPVLLTYSQPGMPETESQFVMPEPELVADNTGTGLVGKLTPMSSLSSIESDAPASPLPILSRPSNLRSSTLDSPLFSSKTSPPSPTKPATSPVPTSRYQLRRRPVLSHAVPYSMQSSHSNAKPSSLPRTRIVRSRGGPSGNRDEAMVVR